MSGYSSKTNNNLKKKSIIWSYPKIGIKDLILCRAKTGMLFIPIQYPCTTWIHCSQLRHNILSHKGTSFCLSPIYPQPVTFLHPQRHYPLVVKPLQPLKPIRNKFVWVFYTTLLPYPHGDFEVLWQESSIPSMKKIVRPIKYQCQSKWMTMKARNLRADSVLILKIRLLQLIVDQILL